MLEMASLPLERVLGPELGRIYLDLHRDHGVEFLPETTVARFEGQTSVERVITADDALIETDYVVVGVGVAPRTGLVETAGLRVDNGIVVDEQLRTSAPDVFAAGDVANAHHPFYGDHIRVEHWDTALHHGPVAARNMLGQAEAYDRIPYFFSDQYETGMEYSGHATDWDEVVFRGDVAAREFIAFWLKDERVVAGMNMNVWDVSDPIRELIRSRRAVDTAELADPDVPLSQLIEPATSEPGREEALSAWASEGGIAVNRLRHLEDAGVSIWLDDLSRELIDSGEFMRLVQKRSVTGATSNPTIFAKAISGSGRYDRQLRLALESGVRDPQEIFFELALEDVRRAADALRAAYDLSDGHTGFVSFECTPDLADDAEATVRQALEVSDRLDVPNALIKVAATDAGIEAIEELTAQGVSVNVTLLFSVERYAQAIGAYWDGLTRRAAAGEPLAHITSVASFFVSRVDAAVDPWLAPGLAPARKNRDRQRPARLRSLSRVIEYPALGSARSTGRPPAATALGEHRDQERRLLRRSLRRGAGRPGSDQHDAAGDSRCLR